MSEFITQTVPWRCPGCPEPPEWELNFDALVEQFEWLRRMDGCPQDPEWHAEGDVLIHVRMVCEAMAASRAWRTLPEPARHIVFAAALLHDVAKPQFTRVEDGRIRSRGHTVGGMRMARRILAEDPAFGEFGTPFHVREQVVGLVRHHGLPGTFLDQADPERAVLTAAVTARCDWLAVLAEADMRGRICAGLSQAIERVGLFQDYAAECGCLNEPYPFASPFSRWRYFRTAGVPPTIDVYDPATFDVIVLSGLPAAGKDTWARRHADDLPVIALDDLRDELDVHPADDQTRVVAAAKSLAKEHLRSRRPFVWNATNTSRMLRDGLVELFTAYGARVRVVYAEAPFNVIRARNAARPRPVPARVIEHLIDRLDVPDVTEAQEVRYAVELTVSPRVETLGSSGK
jgi:predicted kinase